MRTVRRTETRTAETPIASTVHEPFGNPAGPGLFHVKGLQLPAYVQHLGHHLEAMGHPRSQAIHMALGIVQDWAAGHDGHGHQVHPDVQAAAAKAVAEWEAAKAAAHAGKSSGRGAGMAQVQARAKYNADQMKAMAAKGQAMKNASGAPSYPIADEEDLSNAIHAVGRGGSSHNAIRKHIISRAKALGLSSRIPDNWNPDGSMSDSDNDSDGGRSLLADEEVRELRINSCYRDLDLTLETRAGPDGAQWIGGYASVFQPRESRNLGGFIERVNPSAFTNARMGGWPDVVCRFNHNSDLVLGTVAAGTLQLRTDNIGLDYQVLPPESRADVRELVQRGDIRYSSFAFRVPRGGDEWGVTDQNFPMRTLHEVELVDVSPVLTPAYPDATAAVRATAPALRSLADHMQIAVDEVRMLAEQDELRRLFVRTDKPIYRPEPKRLFGPQAAAMLLARREDPYVHEG